MWVPAPQPPPRCVPEVLTAAKDPAGSLSCCCSARPLPSHKGHGKKLNDSQLNTCLTSILGVVFCFLLAATSGVGNAVRFSRVSGSMAASTPDRPEAPITELLAKHIGEDTQLIALLFVDPDLGPSNAFIQLWDTLWREVTGVTAPAGAEGDSPRVSATPARLKTVLVVENPHDKDMSRVALHPHWAVDDRVTAIRMAASLSIVQTFPELVLLDPRADCAAICTDGVSAVRRGSLVPSSFPAGWRTNVLQAALADGSVDSSGAVMHPDTALQAGVYPGDTAILRSAADPSANSACAFINAPEAEHELLDSTGSGMSPSSVTPGTLLLPRLVALNMGIRPGASVVVEPFLSLPEAEQVQLMPLSHAPGLRTAVRQFFGLPPIADAPAGAPGQPTEGLAAPSVAASVQDALASHAEAEEGEAAVLASLLAAGSSSWLVQYASQAACFKRPLASGQVLAVPVQGSPQLPAATVPPQLLGSSTARAAGLLSQAAELLSHSAPKAHSTRGGDESHDVGGAPPDSLHFVGDQLTAAAAQWAGFVVVATKPRGTVVVGPNTDVQILDASK